MDRGDIVLFVAFLFCLALTLSIFPAHFYFEFAMRPDSPVDTIRSPDDVKDFWILVDSLVMLGLFGLFVCFFVWIGRSYRKSNPKRR